MAKHKQGLTESEKANGQIFFFWIILIAWAAFSHYSEAAEVDPAQEPAAVTQDHARPDTPAVVFV